MKSVMKKTSLREIKGTLGRFMAILSIIALGTGFFTGVRITTPAMINIFDKYLKENEFFDLRLVSTLGWEESNVEEFKNQKDVKYAEGSNSFDVLYITDMKEEAVLKTHTLTENINKLILKEGEMPDLPNECIMDSKLDINIGSKIKVSEETPEDTRDSLKYKEFTVVGKADSPYYINFERGTTSIGTGSISGFVYIMPEAVDRDYYSEIFIKFNNDMTIYSDDYEKYIDKKTEKWENIAQEQADLRYNKILSDAEDELNDGKSELADKKKDGQQELDDAEKELTDGKKELDDAEKELKDAEKEISDGQKELDDAKKELDDSKKELDDAKIKIDDGQKELDDAKLTLEDSKNQLDNAENELTDGQEQLNDGERQLKDAWAQFKAGEEELKAKESELEMQENNFNEQYGALMGMISFLPEEQQIMLTSAQAQLAEGRKQIESAKIQLENSRAELESQQEILDEKRQELKNGWTEFYNGKAEYEKGLAEYNKSLEEFEKGKKEYEDGLKKWQDGKKEYEDGVKELESGRKEYADGLKEYEDGKKEYADGLKEYEDGLKEFDEKIADAEKEIADAEDEIADIKAPDVYVLGRNTNIGYACFENDSEIVAQVAKVFPIFFILVAALVCMTTMTRMVEEQRTQIGVFKALGYSEFSIMGKFMFYSGSAALTGCIFGYGAGTYLFPKVIWLTYKLMYTPLELEYMFDPALAVYAVIASLVCSIGVTWLSCRYELSETAANLMRPKAPKAGKRVFLEYIPFIWNRMKFLYKVSVRNIFRYKGRFFMMILGIGGCTALLITGFGIKDSVAGFADVQYEEIQTADASISFKSDENGNIPVKLKNKLDELSKSYVINHNSSWDLIYKNKTKGISLVAPENFDNMDKFMNFRDMEDMPLDYPQNGEALVSHSISARYGVKSGDEIILRNEDMEELHLTVAGVFENHVYNYIFINSAEIEKQLGKAPEFNGGYVNFAKNTDEYQAAAEIAKLSDVTGVTVFDELKTRMGNMMSSLDYVVILVIACAAGLAFIVIYNLTNINITERIREIATIKVLGFFRRESSAYVLRENIALTAIGTIFGIFLGIFFHSFVMKQIIVDLVDFKSRILPMSFVYSVVMTFVFNFIVNIFMEIKLEKINMAESLKSID
ncbi:MAG: ABC transporter permease [Ruminococcus sp.]|nr:ABC transporter permease [Ruminococcus sp.]